MCVYYELVRDNLLTYWFLCPPCGWYARMLFQNFAAEVTNEFLKRFDHKDPEPGAVQVFCDEFEITDHKVVLAMNPCIEKNDLPVRCYMNLRQAAHIVCLLSICCHWLSCCWPPHLDLSCLRIPTAHTKGFQPVWTVGICWEKYLVMAYKCFLSHWCQFFVHILHVFPTLKWNAIQTNIGLVDVVPITIDDH